jgi:PKD repeat protein
MKNTIKKVFFGLSFAIVHAASAQTETSPSSTATKLLSLCLPASAKADLDINNVRAAIMNSGDMWWDLHDEGYEVPKGSGMHSLFAGALWIGALDAGNQLHVAAQTYRQTGNDYWPGPIDSVTHATDYNTCLAYDKIYKLNRSEVLNFISHHTDPGYVIPSSILNWPEIAPFTDVDGDQQYNPANGDYPAYAPVASTQSCYTNLLGDQTLWWVFNDVGNDHTQTGGSKLGFEIRTQAFAYSTFDEINDMTFYQYTMVNRSTNTYHDTYVGLFANGAIGSPNDDYLGCDVGRGMGYFYNGDDRDDNAFYTTLSYGYHPPAIGIDVLDGILADPGDGIDNDRDNTIDESGERIIMSNFIYYYGTGMIDGTIDIDVYKYLQSLTMTGQSITYGGGGIGGTVPCKFHYPGASDPTGWGTGGVAMAPWDEANAGMPPGERAMLLSMGGFTMQPGQVKQFTSAVVWARDTEGDNHASLQKLKLADDKAQALFNSCFQVQCVPPEPVISYSANELTISFSYANAGDNFSWTFGDCGSPGSSQRNPTHTYCKPGTYEVCLSVSNSCGSGNVCIPITVGYNRPGVRLKRIEGTGNGGNYLSFAPGMHDSLMYGPNYRIFQPVYDYSAGPVKIEVIDRTAVPQDIFTISLDTISDSVHWKMYRMGAADTIYSDDAISIGNTQLIPQWGLSVQMKQVQSPGFNDNEGNPVSRNGFISGSMSFADNSKKWLTGLADTDTAGYDNWIRSGRNYSPLPYENYSDIDPFKDFDNVIGGTWAPYRLAASTFTSGGQTYKAGPAWHKYRSLNLISNIAGVDLVITADQSKWSRCPVIELSEESSLAEGNVPKMYMRAAPSVGKNGQPDGTGTGMGWFPGYAVNVETGERLNIMFGEDSWLTSENGRDMLWNPLQTKFTSSGEPIFGGKHYIYILGHNGDSFYSSNPYMGNGRRDINHYDEGASAAALLSAAAASGPLTFDADGFLREVYNDAMWVGIPLLAAGHSQLESDVSIKLRVQKPYAKYQTYGNRNGHHPMYQFDGRDINTPGGLQPDPGDQASIIYPNPFATFSTIQFRNANCEAHTLDIYDARGRLVRKYEGIYGEKVVVDKQALLPGIYLYSLKKESGNVSSGKMVIQ